MAKQQPLSKTELRDLIVDFYANTDPQRLQDGIDISGMVDWTMNEGNLDSLNSMLKSTYGTAIDRNKKLKMNTPQEVDRVSKAISGAPTDRFAEGQRAQIRERLLLFYDQHDPSKKTEIGINKLVEFGLYKGLNALNFKLKAKYGEDLDTFARKSVKQAMMEVPEAQEEESLSVKDAPFEETERKTKLTVVIDKHIMRNNAEETSGEEVFDASHSLNEVPALEDFIQEPNKQEAVPLELETFGRELITEELESFYKRHDPTKLDVLEALVDWALKVGRSEFNKKLYQLYGYTLDNHLPSAPVEPVQVQAPNTPVQSPVVVVKTPPPPLLQEATPTTTTKKTLRVVKKVETMQNAPPSYARFETAAMKSIRKADPLKGPKLIRSKLGNKGVEACDNYRLDMNSNFFGVCVCGQNKTAHSMW